MNLKAIACATVLHLIALGAVPVQAATPVRSWRLDPQRSRVGFQVTKLGYADVEGRFTRFSGDVRFDPDHPEQSSIRWQVRVGSVRTGESQRDQSIQAEEYFDASRHPELSFRSDRVRLLGGGRLEVSGRITVKGRSRPLTIVASPIAGGTGFETRFALDRYDFDVAGGRVMGKLIGRNVKIHLVAVPQGGSR